MFYINHPLANIAERAVLNKATETTRIPAYEISRSGDHYLVEVALPGFSKHNISIEMEDGLLKLKGSLEKNDEAERTVLRSTLKRTPISLDLKLGNDIDAESIKAEMNNGILSITLATREELKPRSIPVV